MQNFYEQQWRLQENGFLSSKMEEKETPYFSEAIIYVMMAKHKNRSSLSSQTFTEMPGKETESRKEKRGQLSAESREMAKRAGKPTRCVTQWRPL